MLAAEAADTIVGFLYRIHTQDQEAVPTSLSLYDSNAGFNDYVDDIHEQVRVFDEDFMPSRILFELAPEPYRLYLAGYRQDSVVSAEGDEAAPASIMMDDSGALTIDAQTVRVVD
jgi:hypothetical protein